MKTQQYFEKSKSCRKTTRTNVERDVILLGLLVLLYFFFFISRVRYNAETIILLYHAMSGYSWHCNVPLQSSGDHPKWYTHTRHTYYVVGFRFYFIDVYLCEKSEKDVLLSWFSMVFGENKVLPLIFFISRHFIVIVIIVFHRGCCSCHSW